MEILKGTLSQLISISEDEAKDFIARCYCRKFKKKEILSEDYKIIDEVYFIEKGIIRVKIYDLNGTEHTIHFAIENQFIADYRAFLTREKSRYQLEALEPTEVIVLPKEAIEWGYKSLKEGQKLGRLIAEYYFTYLDRRIEHLYTLSPIQRYELMNQIFPNIHNPGTSTYDCLLPGHHTYSSQQDKAGNHQNINICYRSKAIAHAIFACKNRMQNIFITITITMTIALSGCYSVKKTVENSHPLSKEISWPEAYIPEESKFFVHNEVDINATPETVWNILINAGEWEDYYKGASNLVLIDNTTGKLDENSVFTWKTMGLDFTSTILEFEAPYRLSWESNKKTIRGYHAWLIVRTENGVKLVTSEAQHGFMTLLQKAFIPNKLSKLHDTWLAEIKHRSESAEK